MILAPCNTIRTFFMRFAIDVAFDNRAALRRDPLAASTSVTLKSSGASQSYILGTRRAMRPSRIQAAWRAVAVVELASRELERS